MRTLILVALLLAAVVPADATTYYWHVNNAYYPVGTVNDGDPDGFVSSTSLSTILMLYSDAKKKQPY